ncbi:TonB-dependent receptor [Marivirga tractuosa]|uniref:TonB-dependent receptor plug n=1 Tax=Marivirga tractuosa (strain ATCC 23168 / DSM 4126 / NBRC 15989 / NCIMB 1408 / VKM B-1430 / H-43) TaxID=643867 RepID=E4TM72_MARTH|nr:TonB-dependent receptor [Marivirga tractuosa]ADR21348.1 TonB-dependent receptor plug [Marivirga tractuosa DSM 4126]BDD14198.1 TonB-dependent receptor [Marivirga tractuosa]
MLRLLFVLIVWLSGLNLINAQEFRAVIKDEKGEPLPFSTAYDHDLGYGATADKNGEIKLDLKTDSKEIWISHVGYQKKKIDMEEIDLSQFHQIQLLPDKLGLNEVVVSGQMQARSLRNSPVKVEVFKADFLNDFSQGSGNLMENISMVNGIQENVACGVCYTNEISINGLEGAYTSLLINGIPIYGNLATVYGLNSIPTDMMEKIEVVRGPGSTLYGSEAMAGVINIITPHAETNSVNLNSSISQFGEWKGNLITQYKAKSWKHFSGFHWDVANQFIDENNDLFSDVVLRDRFSIFNFSENEEKQLSIGGKYYFEDRRNGVVEYVLDRNYKQLRGNDEVYGESIYTHRWELFGSKKFGGSPFRLQFSASQHWQDSFYGDTFYEAEQHQAFSNFIYERTWGNHSFLSGLSQRVSYYDDNSAATENEEGNKPDLQIIPGVFVQDEWKINEKWKTLSGARIDYYNRHGLIFSPRLNVQYQLSEWTNFRFNSGTGFRIVNLFTEDHAFVSGQRELRIDEDLDPERSFNVGLGFQHVYTVGNQQGSIELDGFYTYFTNKIIPDYNTPGFIIYENSEAYAYTRGLSANINHQIGAHLYLNLGAQWQNARQAESNADGILEENPIMYSRDWSAVGSAEYSFPLGIKLNYSFNWNGPTAMPEVYDVSATGEIISSRSDFSPEFTLHNLKLRKEFKRLEVFAGVRNVLDNVQRVSPLSGTQDETTPLGFGEYFDTAYNYGSMMGRNFFMGFDWRIK